MPAQLHPVHVPARIGGIGFTYLRPADFRPMELPQEHPEFAQATAFVPLEVAMASDDEVVFSVTARCAYDTGTIEDWLEQLAEQDDVAILAKREVDLNGLPALWIEASQGTGARAFRMRGAMMEDGRRVVNVAVLAPLAIWPGVEDTLNAMLTSFRLDEPQGSRTPVLRVLPPGVPPSTEIGA